MNCETQQGKDPTLDKGRPPKQFLCMSLKVALAGGPGTILEEGGSYSAPNFCSRISTVGSRVGSCETRAQHISAPRGSFP